MWWTMQISYNVRDDNGKLFRARSVYQVEAADVREAYKKASLDLGERFKLGAIMPGRHMVVP